MKFDKGNKQEMMELDHVRNEPSKCLFNTLYYPAYLLCAPFYVSNDVPNNVWMKDEQSEKEDIKFNADVAFNQFLELYATLCSGGLVHLIPAQQGLQDQVYTANLGLVIPHHIAPNTVILSNYRSEPRASEEEVGRDFFNLMEFDILQPPHFFEGEADIKYIKDNIFVGGYGIRSESAAYDWMMDNVNIKIIKVKMEDEYLYHFDCLFFNIDGENAFVATDLLSPMDVKQIEKVINVIPVEGDMAYGGLTNSARMGNTILCASSLMSKKPTDKYYQEETQKVAFFTKHVTELGFQPIFVDLSEYEKSGAMLSCFVLHLNYFDYTKKYES